MRAKLGVLVFTKKGFQLLASNSLFARFKRTMNVWNDLGDLMGVKIQQHASPTRWAHMMATWHVHRIDKFVATNATFHHLGRGSRHGERDRWNVLGVLKCRVAFHIHDWFTKFRESVPGHIQRMGQGQDQMIGGWQATSLLQPMGTESN